MYHVPRIRWLDADMTWNLAELQGPTLFTSQASRPPCRYALEALQKLTPLGRGLCLCALFPTGLTRDTPQLLEGI